MIAWDRRGASSLGIAGTSSPRTAGALSRGFIVASDFGVDGSIPPASPGVAPPTRELSLTRGSARCKFNTEDDRQLEGAHTLMIAEGQP